MAAFFYDEKMRLTLKNIIRWEQLMKLPFSKVDFSNETHAAAFIYVATSQAVSFKVFQKAVFSKAYKEEMKSLADELTNIQQFIPTKKKGNEPLQEQKLGDIAYDLIAKGVDATYVMNDLSIVDLPYLAEALSRKEKQEMESQRLWTYLSILPHVDSSKLKSPTDLLPFPWDIDQEALEKEKQEAFQMFNQFTESYGK